MSKAIVMHQITDAGVIKPSQSLTILWFVIDDVQRHEIPVEHPDFSTQQKGQDAFSVLCNAVGEVGVEDSDIFVGKTIDSVSLSMVIRTANAIESKPALDSHYPIYSKGGRGKYIYVISCTDTKSPICKIGIATTPETRLQQLSTASPHALRVEYTRFCEHAASVEAEAHQFFKRHRRNGEWFDVHPVRAIRHINAVIDEVRAQNA